MRDFKELQVWQKSHRFALDVYRQTRNFPADERFGLCTQVRRAAVALSASFRANG